MLHRDEQALREYLPACRALADTLQDLVRSEGCGAARAGERDPQIKRQSVSQIGKPQGRPVRSIDKP